MRKGFKEIFDALAKQVHDAELIATAVEKGFWPEEARKRSESILLMRSEFSKALEVARYWAGQDDNIPTFSREEVALADMVILIMGHSAAFNLNVGGAILAKILFNEWFHPKDRA